MILRYRSAAATILITLLAGPSLAGDWTRFRGPNGTGVSSSTGLPVEFGPQRNMAWVTELPFARSSPVVVADWIFVTAIDDDRFLTLALDRRTGETRWQRVIARDRADEMYHGTDSATSTPVTDGSQVFVFFQETGLVAYTVAGEESWRLPLGPFRNFYGIAASPILAGDTLLLICDQARGSFLLAVDKQTGRERWRQQRPARLESYTTPVLYPDSGHPHQAIISGSAWVDAYDLATGENSWSLPGVGTGPVASPLLYGDLLIVNAPDQASEPPPPFGDLLKEHDKNGDDLLAKAEVEGSWMFNHFGFLDEDADGDLSASDWQAIMGSMVNDSWGLVGIRVPESGEPEILWRSQQSVAYIPTTLIYEGVLYMVKDGIVSSYDPQTGELHKRGRLTDGSPKVYASPVAAEGKIFMSTLEGVIAVVRAGADWQVMALNDLGDEIYASPAIVDGHLLVRTKSRLFSFAEQKKSAAASAD